MKYIFRYALLTNFTYQQQQITSDQLNQALKSVKYHLNGRKLEDLVDKSRSCVEILLKNSEKKDLESIIRQCYGQEGLLEGQANELLNVWETERHLIYKKMIAQNTKSSQRYSGVSWSVRNSISSKAGITNSKTLHLILKNDSTNFQTSLNKVQFQQLSQSLSSAQTFLEQLFTS